MSVNNDDPIDDDEFDQHLPFYGLGYSEPRVAFLGCGSLQRGM